MEDIYTELYKTIFNAVIENWYLFLILAILWCLTEYNKISKKYAKKSKKKKESTITNKNISETQNKNIVNEKNNYINSDYYKETNIDYNEMMSDKGKSGEYSISRMLEKINSPKKLMFNTYIPTDENKTTEIDIILIHSTGLYIIESKNFKGWIIGDETHEKWQQTTWIGKKQNKYFFYNPIKQNSKHIVNLKKIIGDKKTISIIAFGDEAIIKKAEHTNPDLDIINTKQLYDTIQNRINNSDTIYTNEDIEDIYVKLKPFSGAAVPDEIKQQHINNANIE